MNIRKLMYLSQINNSYGEQLVLYGNYFHKNVKNMISPEDIELFRTNDFYHDWKINKELLQYVDEAFPTLSIEIRHGKEQATTFLFSNVFVYEKNEIGLQLCIAYGGHNRLLCWEKEEKNLLRFYLGLWNEDLYRSRASCVEKCIYC